MSKSYIPEELLECILLMLPVKSLIRFKLVSKPWSRIINNPLFVKRHMNAESNMKIIAVGVKTGSQNQKVYDVEDFNLGKISNLKEIKYLNKMDEITFIGSCNGLVCLVCSNLTNLKREGTIVLWNPSTREHLVLPEQYRNSWRIYDHCLHGFGYDENTDDYRVVRLVRYQDMNDRTSSEFSIFSLKSNRWKSYGRFKFADHIHWKRIDSGIVANGALHWMLSNNSILAFNIGIKKFHVIQPPQTSIKLHSLYVAFLSGRQYLIFYNLGGREKWIMKDYGEDYSWTELNSDLLAGKQLVIMSPWYFCKNIEIYNFENQSFEIVNFPFDMVYWRACPYFGSLVRLHAGGVNSN